MPEPPEFELRSNEQGAWFRITPADPDAPPEEYEYDREGPYWVATLRCGEMRASVHFYDLNIAALPAYLDALAADWRGWDGERCWESQEGEVSIAATHNKLGRITATVGVKNLGWVGFHHWIASAELILDAGSLDRIARNARALS